MWLKLLISYVKWLSFCFLQRIKYKLAFCFREVSNGIEKKGKKKSVGRPPGPYTRKMIQKTAEPPLVRGFVYKCSRERFVWWLSVLFQLKQNCPLRMFLFFLSLIFFFLNFQDKESVSENPVLDLPCSIG